MLLLLHLDGTHIFDSLKQHSEIISPQPLDRSTDQHEVNFNAINIEKRECANFLQIFGRVQKSILKSLQTYQI